MPTPTREPRDLLADKPAIGPWQKYQNKRQPRDLLADQTSTGLIEIEAPDGSIVEFPKGTPDETIERAMQAEYGGPAHKTSRHGSGNLTLDQQRALALARARKRLADGEGGNGPWTKYQTGQTMSAHEPGFMERMGNATYDTLKDLGLPVDRMRRDNTNLDNFARGVADSLTFGTADEIAAGANAVLGGDYEGELRQQRAIDTAGGPYRTAGQVAGGVTGGAGLIKRGLSPAFNVAKSGAGFVPTAGTSLIEGATLAGLHGFGSGKDGAKSRGLEAYDQGKFGALFGLGGPIVTKGAGKLKRLMAPRRMTNERNAFVNTLDREGIETTAGQQRGSERLRRKEAAIGGRMASGIIDRQQDQFTAAALKRVGLDAHRATPEVIDEGFTRIGQKFDGLAARNTLMPDQPFVDDIQEAVEQYHIMVPPTGRVPAVEQYATDILRASQTGLNGGAYQAVRSRMEKAARSSRNDPQLSEAFRGLRDALDGGMERSIMRNNPRDVGAWREARRQYRNMMVIEKASTYAGERAAQGVISPSHLRNATVAQSRRAYARGQGDFSELARAGEAVMRPLPQSGTTPSFAAALPGGLPGVSGGGIGAAAGGAMFGMPGAVIGAGVGAAAPAATGRMMMSGTGQRFLANRPIFDPVEARRQAIVDALTRHIGNAATGDR